MFVFRAAEFVAVAGVFVVAIVDMLLFLLP